MPKKCVLAQNAAINKKSEPMKYNFLGSFLFFSDVEILQAFFNVFLIYTDISFCYGFTAMIKNMH